MLQKIHPHELQNFLKINFNKTSWWADLNGPYIFRDVLNNILKNDYNYNYYEKVSTILQRSRHKIPKRSS